MRGYLAVAAFAAAVLCFLAAVTLHSMLSAAAGWSTLIFACTGAVLLFSGPVPAREFKANELLEKKLDLVLKRKMDLEAQLRVIHADLDHLCKQVDQQATGMPLELHR
jgi:hypothetical protein